MLFKLLGLQINSLSFLSDLKAKGDIYKDFRARSSRIRCQHYQKITPDIDFSVFSENMQFSRVDFF